MHSCRSVQKESRSSQSWFSCRIPQYGADSFTTFPTSISQMWHALFSSFSTLSKCHNTTEIPSLLSSLWNLNLSLVFRLGTNNYQHTNMLPPFGFGLSPLFLVDSALHAVPRKKVFAKGKRAKSFFNNLIENKT